MGLVNISESKDGCHRLTAAMGEPWLLQKSTQASVCSNTRTETGLIPFLKHVLKYFAK